MGIQSSNNLGEFPLSFEEWENKAKAKLSPEQFAFVFAGAGDGDSIEENHRSLRRWRLIPRVLRNGSNQMGWPTYVQEIIIGVVIIIAVAVDRLRQGGMKT